VLGVFGLLAYSVAQQVGEIGIRIALGAPRSVVMRRVIGRGLGILGAGMSFGSVVTLVATRVLEPFLFQVGTLDLATVGTVALLLTVASIGAGIIPARKAMGVDPLDALRAE